MSWLQFAVVFTAFLQLITSQFWLNEEFGEAALDPPVPTPELLAQPAGYAFGIWFLIYFACLGFALYQAWPRLREDVYLNTVRPYVAAGFFLNAFWLFCATQGPLWFTPLVITGLLLAVGFGFLYSLERNETSQTKYYLTSLPLAVYTGWVGVAFWLNWADILAGYGLSLGIEEPWRSLLVLFGALGLAIFLVRRSFANVAYTLTVAWALLGILVKNGSNVVGITALAVLVIVGFTFLYVRSLRTSFS